jgi:methanogenic corrinoid protein MtbC1
MPLANRTLDGLELVRAAVKKRPLADVIDRLLMPVLAEVGRRWSDKAISVADEHLASANAYWIANRLLAVPG